MGNYEYKERPKSIADSLEKIKKEHCAEWDGKALDYFVSDHSGGANKMVDHVADVGNMVDHIPDAEKMVPLTLEQLQDMYDRPAKFVDLYTDFDENVIVGVFGKTGVFYSTLEETNQFKSTKDYGQRWIAYAYPTAHIDLEAWTAEWIPQIDDDGCCWHQCSSCGHDLDSLEVPSAFCPSCGKAMTPEARAMLEKRLRGCNE